MATQKLLWLAIAAIQLSQLFQTLHVCVVLLYSCQCLGYLHRPTWPRTHRFHLLIRNTLISYLEPPSISLTSSPPSPITAGDNVTLTCSVTLPTGLTGTPDFRWEGPGVTPTPDDPIASGQRVSSDLTLSEIATSQAGQYTCTATLNGTPHVSHVIIDVQSKITQFCVLCVYSFMQYTFSPSLDSIHHCQ